ncbi:hypothetical protein LCGC14_2027280 [marine sediment metagenome]|uniref:Uncharacterized protein n=1 Tax=marine sediment metagenome TaxID=412755 RepID=A0A0F9H969_9ZZZZ
MSSPEEIRYDGQQQDREDKRREMLERRARMGGPDAPEACLHCGGDGSCSRVGADSGGVNCSDPQIECPHCLGTGVRP